MSQPTTDMVAMRDDVRLATDIFPANDGGARPAVLERTPYGRRIAADVERLSGETTVPPAADIAEGYRKSGFAYVRQDCRGTGDSEGVLDKYLAEAEDGFDTIAWVAAQTWCDGRVFTAGFSYSATAQLAAACLAPPGLAGMVLDCGGFFDARTSGIRQGGALDLKQATWAIAQAQKVAIARCREKAMVVPPELTPATFRKPWKADTAPVANIPGYAESAVRYWTTPEDDPLWEHPALCARAHLAAIPDVPILFATSWVDTSARAAFELAAALREAGRTAPLHVIAGPWTHGNRHKRHAGDADMGAQALEVTNGKGWAETRLDFLRAAAEARAPEMPALRYFEMGGGTGRSARGDIVHGGTWRSAPEPELAATDSLEHWFTPSGALTPEPPTHPAALDLPVDPDAPVPAIGGAIHALGPFAWGGLYDQRCDARFGGDDEAPLGRAARADVLSFATPPLQHDVVLHGATRLEVMLDLPENGGDICAVLIDVYPDGTALNIADGIRRTNEGGRQRLSVTLSPAANRFVAGHSIRVDLAGTHFPRFDVNPAYPGPVMLRLQTGAETRLSLPIAAMPHKEH